MILLSRLYSWTEFHRVAFTVNGFRYLTEKPATAQISADLNLHVDIVDLLFAAAQKYPLGGVNTAPRTPQHTHSTVWFGFNETIDLVAVTRTPRWERGENAYVVLTSLQHGPLAEVAIVADVLSISVDLAAVIIASLKADRHQGPGFNNLQPV